MVYLYGHVFHYHSFRATYSNCFCIFIVMHLHEKLKPIYLEIVLIQWNSNITALLAMRYGTMHNKYICCNDIQLRSYYRQTT